MKRMTQFVIAFGWVACTQAHAGLEIIDSDGTVTLAQAGKMMSGMENGDEDIYIFDANSNTLTVVQQGRQRYARGTVQDYCQAVIAMSNAAMAGMTQEERRMMQQLMGNTGNTQPRRVEIKERDDGGKIAGYSVRHYAVHVDGQLSEELWLSEDRALLAEFGDFAKIEALGTEMGACLAEGMDVGGWNIYQAPEYKKLLRQGMELKSIDYSFGAAMVNEVREIRIRQIPEARFAPPAGYRAVGFQEILQEH